MSSSVWILNVMAVGGLFTCCENWSETVNGTGDFKKSFLYKTSDKVLIKCHLNPNEGHGIFVSPIQSKTRLFRFLAQETNKKTNQLYLKFPIITVWGFLQSKKTIRETSNQIWVAVLIN